MSVNLRPKISTPGGEATVGLIVSLCLAVAVALSGCAETGKEQTMGGANTGAAAGGQVPPTCEEVQQQAVLSCQQVYGPGYGGGTGNMDELQACLDEATQNLEDCRSK